MDGIRAPLLVAVAQPACVAHDVGANAAAHASAVRSSGARVVLFPEMSLTGYELDAPALGLDDPALAPLVNACGATGTVALAGAPVAGDGDAVHIGVVRVDGDGVALAYRKMYLGGAEAERFTPGPGPAAVEVDGWRLGLAVCKDTGVPQQAAVTAALGVDAYLAGVLEHADDARVIDDRARHIAVGHGVWVAVASFAGSTGGGYGRAAGRSGVWGPDATPVVRAGPEVGAVARTFLGAVRARPGPR
jgi:predicted amidohydrolase